MTLGNRKKHKHLKVDEAPLFAFISDLKVWYKSKAGSPNIILAGIDKTINTPYPYPAASFKIGIIWLMHESSIKNRF